MATMEQAVGILVLLVASTVEVKSNPIFGDLHPAATTPYTHISSFLNQWRSTGSRADKPDVEPHFEVDVGTTTGPTISRLQVYKHPVGRVLGEIRDRVSNAIAQGRDEGLFADRLQLRDTTSSETDETTTEFVGLTLEEESDGPSVVFETTNTTSEEPGSVTPEEGFSPTDGVLAAKFKNKTRALATLVFTPLLSVWTTAQRNLHFPAFGGALDDGSNQDSQEELEEEEIEQQQSTDSMQSWIKGGIKQNLREMPFRTAFYKYSNFAGRGSNNNDNPAPGSPQASRSVSAGAEVNLDNGGLDDDDDKPPAPDSATDGPRLMLNEGLGIYVLEIIGTIVGLTWGAISQIQTIFGGRQ